MSIFTDHYFEVTETFRGEAPEDNIVAVRQQGGAIGNDAVEIEPSCDFQEGKSYLLFLYRPGKGGFSTEGDYYCLRGEVYGAYPLDGTTLAEVSTDQVVNEVESNAIQVADFQQQVDYYNETIRPHWHDDPGRVRRSRGRYGEVRHLCGGPSRRVQRR